MTDLEAVFVLVFTLSFSFSHSEGHETIKHRATQLSTFIYCEVYDYNGQNYESESCSKEYVEIQQIADVQRQEERKEAFPQGLTK
jgi:hypothetical protein